MVVPLRGAGQPVVRSLGYHREYDLYAVFKQRHEVCLLARARNPIVSSPVVYCRRSGLW